MSESNGNKKYVSLKIPNRKQGENDGVPLPSPQAKTTAPAVSDEELFYEIDYGSCSIPGVGKFVLKPQKIEPPETDEIRDLFQQMRQIARDNRPVFFTGSRFYDQKVRKENANVFYKQGMFMKDFNDHYTESVPYSSYFPYYQMMGYEQLRTYFTWRAEVRKGRISGTSLSYAFLYIYELLNNIGVDNPQDGLDRLMTFWETFSVYDKTIDKYLLKWLKDYHIYYELPHSFKEFVDKNGLASHYPGLSDTDDRFGLFCTISKYDIRKSAYYQDNEKLISDCFCHVIKKLGQIFSENGIPFEETIFQPTRKTSVWTPFQSALFYQWKTQPDRRIVLSKNEIYLCCQNEWSFSSVITSENGKHLIGYIMKQMESALRKVTNYRFRLSANIKTVPHAVTEKLSEAGLSLETIISHTVMEFYREATKTIVAVDRDALSRIRLEALATQEKLVVPEQNEQGAAPAVLPLSPPPLEKPPVCNACVSITDPWVSLRNTLSKTELEAISFILSEEPELKKFADEHGVMLEVLIDGINEKAMDLIGDSLIDEAFLLYDDYKNKIREMVK